MKHLGLFFIAALFVATLSSCASSASNDKDSAKDTASISKTENVTKVEEIDWSGTYKFSEGGETEYGDRFWEYTIAVQKAPDGNYRADKDTDGFQTMERINCTGKVIDGKLVLYFESFDEDNMLGTEGGEKGKVEATISKTADGKFMVNANGVEIEYAKK